MSAPQTYGASLYDLAKDEGMSREILVDLAGIVSLFNEHPAYVKILDAPQIERDDLMEILNEDFLGKVNRYVLNFLKLLSEKHSVHHIGECFKTYEKLYNEDNSIKIVNVTTAKPIGKHLEEKLLQKLEPVNADGSFEVSEQGRNITIKGNNFEYIFDKSTGNFKKLSDAVTRPVEWNMWRAPTDNDRNIMHDWINADYHREQSYVYDCTYDVADTVTIKCHNALIPVVQRKHMDIETVWTIYANGIIDMQSSVKVGENLPVIPRFGLRFFTKGENVKYYGYGSYESYSDKHLCTYLDEFNTTVSDMYEPYIKPQENGSHFGTRYVETENIRVSSDTPFSFSALHYTQEELTEKKHNFELEKCDDTVLCIDYKQNGIGQNSCGPLTQEEYRFDESEFEFKIRIEIK